MLKNDKDSDQLEANTLTWKAWQSSWRDQCEHFYRRVCLVQLQQVEYSAVAARQYLKAIIEDACEFVCEKGESL